jgi:hypothetical protein
VSRSGAAWPGTGHRVGADDLATISPLIRHTIRRFGDWHLDLTPPPGEAHLALPPAGPDPDPAPAPAVPT